MGLPGDRAQQGSVAAKLLRLDSSGDYAFQLFIWSSIMACACVSICEHIGQYM